MKKKVAINGFGRIGRLVFRAYLERSNEFNETYEISYINDLADIDSNIHLLKYDSVHGALSQEIKKTADNKFKVGTNEITVTSKKNPIDLNWSEKEIDVILQSSKINHITIIASGSEVSLAIETANLLKEQKIETKVVSMPSSSVFDEQHASFKKKLLQSKLEQVFVIEAGSTMYWNKYTQSENIFGIDEFGASAPAKDVFNKFGLTPKNISSKIMKRIKK